MSVRIVTRTFVSLDLETTGLAEDDRVTEIGAVRFDETGAVLETYEQLVNPGRAIPPFVARLTGITDADVAGAPPIQDVAAEVRRFIGDGPVVGQNVRFDLGYLRREGVLVETVPQVDTVVLSRHLIPERQPRNLEELSAHLGVEVETYHRALPDARTAAAVFAALLSRAAAIPEDTRLQMARLIWLHDPVVAELIAGRAWEGLPQGERSLPAIRPAPTFEALQKRDLRQVVIKGELERALAAAPSVFDGFEAREEQGKMAEAVRRAMAEGGHWLIEAGTGVGKSLAYLLPAAMHALRNGERVVISTNTIALQEQLIRKDIPALRRILVAAGEMEDEADLRAALLKGRQNYLCVRRWMASYMANLGDPDFAQLATRMLLWLPETETGDRSELSLDRNDFVTWQRFSAQDTDCLAKQPVWVREGKCFLQRARKAGESAHLIVVNHALLLADVAAGGAVLPAFDHLIIDEAHNLEEQATRQFGGTVSRRLLAEALEGLHRPRQRDQREGGVVTLLKQFPEGGVTMAAAALEQAVSAAAKLLAPTFETLAAHVPRGTDDDRVVLDATVRASPTWSAANAAWVHLDRALSEVNARAETASQLVMQVATTEEPDAIAGEVDTARRKVEDLRSLLNAFLQDATDGSSVTWLARERDGSASVNTAPLDVGPRLWAELFEKRRTVVATSATLAANGSMEYAAKRIGLETPRTLQLGSPFDYESSTLLAAITDVPEPSDRGYNEAVAPVITRLVRAAEGRTLALFTSHAALQAVATLIRPELEAAGINVFAQGVDGDPRHLTENLRTNPRSVVLGAQSFWEGVDIRGEALSQLIIVKLPFAVPTDPVQRARGEQYANPFEQYSLPSAILRFRQGFGRLIRDRTDRGVVAVLDRRLTEKRYGRAFVDALPPCTRIKAASPVVAERVREWLE